MGRRSRELRERRERKAVGLVEPTKRDPAGSVAEKPGNPIARIARKAVSLASRREVVKELSKGSVSDQTGRLDELVGVGVLPVRALRVAIMREAPKEMDKAIEKFRKQGKEVTVDSLLAEMRSEPGFLEMCRNAGITYEWFEKLAKERMEAYGL